MLRLLQLRIVVNEKSIYEFKEKQPVVIPCNQQVTTLTVTNGFHHSRMVSVKCKPGIHLYEVESFIDNIQLLTGLAMTLLFFGIYILSGIVFFMLFANVPLLIMLYLIYIKRNSFIQVHLLKPGDTQVRN